MFNADDIHPMRAIRRLRGGPAFARAEARTIQKFPTMDNVYRQMNFIAQRYNEALMYMPFDDRPTDSRIMNGIINELSFAILFVAGGRNVFSLSPDVIELLSHTDASQVRMGDIELPYRRFYISFEGGLSLNLPGAPNKIDGAYIIQNDNQIGMFVTTRSTTASRSSLTQRIQHPEPRFLAYLTLDDPEAMLDAMIEKAIESNDIGVKPEKGAVERLHEGIEAEKVGALEMGVDLRRPEVSGFEREAAFTLEALPVGRRIISLIANILCFMTTKPDCGKPQWPTEAPRSLLKEFREASTDRRRHVASDKLADLGLFSVRRLSFEASPPAASPQARSDAPGIEMAPHWRRGHWRRQPHGPARLERRLVWIRPILVRADLGEAEKGRVYRLEAKGAHTP